MRTDPSLPELGVFSCPVPTAHSTRLPFQVVVEGLSSSTELYNLTSSTEYLVSVFPVYKAGAAEGLRGLVTTGGWGQGGQGSGWGLLPPADSSGAWHQEWRCSGQLWVLSWGVGTLPNLLCNRG